MELIKWQQQQQELANPPLAEANRTHWNCSLCDATSLPTLPSEVAEVNCDKRKRKVQIGSPCRERERESGRESARESAPESVREIAKMAKRKWRCNWIGRFSKIYAGCKAFVEQTKRTNFLIKTRRKLQSSGPDSKIPFDQFWNKHDQHMINSNFKARFSIPRKQTDMVQLTRIAILIYTLWCLPGVHCPQSKHTLFWQF